MKINKKLLATLLVSPLAAATIACGGDDNGENPIEPEDKLYYTWAEPGIDFVQGKGVKDAEMDALIESLKAVYVSSGEKNARNF